MTQTLAALQPGSYKPASDAYHNVNQLQQLKSLGDDDGGASLDAISRQFESLLVHQMLKSMRSANRIWSDGNFLSSDRVDFYQQMLDDQLSIELTRGEGLGFAGSVRRQLDRADTASSKGEVRDLEKLPPRAVRAAMAELEPGRDEPAQMQSAQAITIDRLNTGQPGTKGEQAFVDTLLPHAQRAADKLGAPVEQVIAQAALETGWGRAIMQNPNGSSSFNLFGIKAGPGWDGDAVSKVTSEFYDGREIRVRASFRSYASLEQAFDDYVHFLSTNPRYRGVHNAQHQFAGELQRAGYATDPHYASKVERISRQLGVPDVTSDQPLALNDGFGVAP